MKSHNRLRDIIFLDLALDSTVRTTVERALEGLSNASAGVCNLWHQAFMYKSIVDSLITIYLVQDIIYMITIVLENLCLSSSSTEELVYCLKARDGILLTISGKCNVE